MPIANLPPAELVTRPECYHKMITHLGQQEAIAIDTESNSLFTYQERVCLIQLSSHERDYLLDPFAFEKLSELGHLMTNPDIEKLMHAGDYDIATLKRDYGFEFQNVFDTMLAATALGESNLGLGTLLEKYFGIKLAKKYQRANWGERPLKDEMLRYAQADSHFLIPLRDYLLPRLQQIGWLELVREDSNAMAKNMPAMKPHREDVWRLKGARNLNPSEMSLLDALNHQRELMAVRRNRPPFKIMSNTALVAIAQTAPRTLQDLSQLKALSPHQMKRYGKVLISTVNRWLEAPAKLYRPPSQHLSESEFDRQQDLKDLRKKIARREGMASNLIIPRDLMEKIAKPEIQTIDELEAVMSDYPLRFKRYGVQIFAKLQRSNA